MTESVGRFEMFVPSTLLSTASNELEHNSSSTFSTLLQTTVSDTAINKTTDATPTTVDIAQDNSAYFILIPFVVLLFIVALSGLVFLIGRNRRRLSRIYCRRRNGRKYSFDDDSDSTLEQVEDTDFDDPTECLLKGKLQIDNSYASTIRKDLCT